MTAAPDLSRTPPDAFARALAFTLPHEGGKVDNPLDRGGRTAYGITQHTYDLWRGKPGRDVWLIDMGEVSRIYRSRYWDEIDGDQLAGVNERLSVCVFDTAVNSGVRTASRMLQRTAHAEPDGVIGKVTLSCLRLRQLRLGPDALLTIYLERRAGLYRAILLRDPTQRVFRKGWMARLRDLATHVGIESVWEDD